MSDMVKQKKELTPKDIERYAAQYGDNPHSMLGVLLSVVGHLMSDDKWKRDITKQMLREWAGGQTPNEPEQTNTADQSRH